jgi:hypothetical protein
LPAGFLRGDLAAALAGAVFRTARACLVVGFAAAAAFLVAIGPCS